MLDFLRNNYVDLVYGYKAMLFGIYFRILMDFSQEIFGVCDLGRHISFFINS